MARAKQPGPGQPNLGAEANKMGAGPKYLARGPKYLARADNVTYGWPKKTTFQFIISIK